MRSPVQFLRVGGVLAAAVLGVSSGALGSDALTVLTVEGNAVCNQFAINAEITQLQQNSPGASFTVSDSTQSISGTVLANRLSWQATVPVNFAIVTRTGGPTRSNVYVFGNQGVLSDSDEIAPGGGAIQRVRFCYGLEGSFEPRPLQACDSEEVGQSCPSEVQQVRIIWDLATPNDVSFCTCNIDFETCDLTPGATENACFPRTLNAVNSTIELYNTPFCLTSTTGGTPRKGACF